MLRINLGGVKAPLFLIFYIMRGREMHPVVNDMLITLDIELIWKWLAAIAGIIGVLAGVIRPVYNLVKKYNRTLNAALKTIEEQSLVNCAQDQTIQYTLGDIDKIKSGLCTQMRIELLKITERALSRGYRTMNESSIAEMTYSGYKELDGNGEMVSKMSDFRNLPLKGRGQVDDTDIPAPS